MSDELQTAEGDGSYVSERDQEELAALGDRCAIKAVPEHLYVTEITHGYNELHWQECPTSVCQRPDHHHDEKGDQQ